MRQKYSFFILLAFLLVNNSCTTTKRKGEVSKMGKVYHNTTAQYNGYFNANELYQKSILILNDMQQDNYNQILPLYTYRDVEETSGVVPDLNIAIEKVSKVINLHRVSNWTDDCYLLLGKAQYLKQDFETAEKSFEYFVDEMQPSKLKIEKSTGGEKAKKSSSKKRKSTKKKRSKTSVKKTEPEKKLVTGSPEAKGGFLSKEPAYNEGLVWMGKTYVERERWPSAAYIISKLESSNVDKDVAREIPVLKAYYFIKQKKYDEALAPLLEATQLAKKGEKARYAYILAQLFELQDNEKKAFEMYSLALDNTSDYEMEFNAQLKIYKNSLGGNNSEKSILKALDKLLKEEKYNEYQDQIYFTIAEIYYKKDDFEQAFKYYQLSLQNNYDNEALKSEVFYKLANRYFNEQSYLSAKYYYDSTLMFMPKSDDRYLQVKKYGQNLNQIAVNLTTIELQDSLLRVGKMTKDEQMELALKIRKEKDEVRKLQREGNASGNTKILSDKGIDRTNIGKDLSKVSSFFAYNENTVKIGKMDFQRKWDDRSLEDDWRRSNKQGGFASEEEDEKSAEVEDLSDAEFKSILKDVPLNEAAIKESEDKIKNAMLELGVLYRDKLENYELSATTLSELIEKYPGFDEECKALYYQHLSYKDLKENTKALASRNRMIGEYPDCSFTQVLTDPDYLAKQLKLLNKKETLYQNAFGLFKEDRHTEAYEIIKQAPEIIGKDESYAIKFDFLEAMCLGKLEGEEVYINKLENLVKRYPNTPEEIKAKEILRFIKGDKKAFEPLIYKEGLENFVMEEDKLHYIFVVLYGIDQDQLKDVKRAISKYNGKYHKLERLRISNIYLDTTEDIQIILVRKFDDKEKSMKYFYQVESRGEDFLPGEYNYELFAISQKNYREVIKQRSVNGYREFFASKYIEEEE